VQFLLSGQNLGLEKYTYDVFGKPKIVGWNGDVRGISLYGNRFLFTGREYLYTLGIYDYRHRHYHPGLGRFIQTDPIGFGGDPMNLYRYCSGNPILHGDPTGLVATGRDSFWEMAKWFDSANTSALQGSFGEHMDRMDARDSGAGGEGASRSIEAKNQLSSAGTTSQNGSAQSQSYGAGTTIERSEENHGVVKIPPLYYQTYINFKYVLKDALGNPLPAGVPVHESITFTNQHFVLPKTPEFHDGVTLAGGIVRDHYATPFYLMGGHSTINQTLQLPSGAKMNWSTTMKYNGNYTTDTLRGSFQ
jgi:RHS repeat-associated protein